jgi:hypothetical protein
LCLPVGVRSSRGYAPKGETPAVKRTEKKENAGMVSAVTSRGKVFWKPREGSINGEKFIDFVKRLISNKKNKIFLILEAVSKPRTNLGLPVFTASPQLNLTAKAPNAAPETGTTVGCARGVIQSHNTARRQ